MSTRPEHVMMCPICLETMKKPILQCEKGHSMCGDCITSSQITCCPQCRAPLSRTRNYQLEQLIEGLQDCLKLPCFYDKKGCPFKLLTSEKESHEQECKFRNLKCEGHSFAKWKCDWSGGIQELEGHFKEKHKNNISMQFKTEAAMKICFSSDYRDVQIISFFNGAQYFYYKHKIDVARQKAYWTFQFIGTKREAANYYYEFEIYNGPLRKFKVTEVCYNDVVKAEEIFEEERCVAISFATLRTYLNKDGELPFKFRLMAVKKAQPDNLKGVTHKVGTINLRK